MTGRNLQSNLSVKAAVGEGRMKFGPLKPALSHSFPLRSQFGFPFRHKVPQLTHTALEQSSLYDWQENANIILYIHA